MYFVPFLSKQFFETKTKNKTRYILHLNSGNVKGKIITYNQKKS